MGPVLPFVAFLAAGAAEEPPRTARIGVYVTALRLHFPEDDFEVEFWVWATTDGDDGWNPLETLEVVDAQSVDARYPASVLRSLPDGSDVWWHTRKMAARLPQDWDLDRYPFDWHTLTVNLEESVDDVSSVRYAADVAESAISPDLKLEGWEVSQLALAPTRAGYSTTFGDPALPPGHGSEYARLTATVDLRRVSIVGFWKLTVGVYVAFLLTALSFFLDPSERGLNPRVGMLSASLFSILVNWRVAESSFGRAESLTLVDRVHVNTLLFIVVASAMTVVSRQLCEAGHVDLARRLDRRVGVVVLTISYLALHLRLLLSAVR